MKRGTHRHPKMANLARFCHRPIPACIGFLHLLWESTAEFAPQGDIGRFGDDWIEASCQWNGTKGALVKALLDAKWVESDPQSRLIVHDWHDHCEDSVRKRLKRLGLPFLSIHKDTAKVTEHLPDMDGQNRNGLPDMVRLPSPSPSLEPIPIPTADAGNTDALILEALQPDPYEVAMDAIREFWPKDKVCGTKAKWLSSMRSLIPKNGKSTARLQQLVVTCREYVQASGDLCYGFPKYCTLSADGPVVPFHQSNGNGSAKPDHGIKPKLDFHTAKPKDPNAEPIRFDIPRGEMK